MTQPISNLNLNAKVKFGKYQGSQIVWRIANKNHPGYPSNSITLVSDVILCEKAFDAKEPSNSNSDRKSYGNNRYRYSNIRQWLNKSGHPWYAAQHSADAPPNSSGVSTNPYDTEQGFLTEFTDDELNAILDTSLQVVIPDVDGGGIETVTDKIFLLSGTEVGLGDESSGKPEGSQLPIFTDDASRIAQFNGSNDYWWLRTPNAGYAISVRNVYFDGSLYYYYAYNGLSGVRPALNLKSDILVSDSPDYDGAYTIIWATLHRITLDKPITINAGEQLTKVHLEAKQADTALQLKEIDAEKYIYEGKDLNTNIADIEVDGEDTTLDKIAYTIS